MLERPDGCEIFQEPESGGERQQESGSQQAFCRGRAAPSKAGWLCFSLSPKHPFSQHSSGGLLHIARLRTRNGGLSRWEIALAEETGGVEGAACGAVPQAGSPPKLTENLRPH